MGRSQLVAERSHWRRASLAALLLLSAGCTSDWFRREESRRADDPLLGGYGRAANQPIAVATANQPQPTYNPTPPPATGSLPPLVPATPTSNAALASGAFQPLAGSNDLRIGNNSPTLGGPPNSNAPWQPTGTVTDPRLGSGNPSAGSPIRPVPQDGGTNAASAAGSPVRPVSGNGGPAPVAAVPSTGTGLDQALNALASYNPVWHKLTYNSQTREYLFEAKVPDRRNASQIRNIDATAPTPEAAVRQVLGELGRDQ